MTIDRQWWVYMVRCADETLYTGISPDVERRIAMHNAGIGAKYTMGRRPVQLVYSVACDDRSQASKRERAIKNTTRSQKEALIHETNT